MEKKVMPGTLKECNEQLSKVAADLKAMRDGLKEGTVTLDADKNTELDRMLDEHQSLYAHSIRLKSLEDAKFEAAKRAIDEKTQKDPEKRDANKAFSDFLRTGRIADEDRDIMNDLCGRGMELMGMKRGTDPQSHTVGEGGYLIPEGFQAEVDKSLLPYFQMLDFCRVLPTNSGNDIPWPTVNDTANKGALLAENAEVVVGDVDFLSTTLKAYKFTSKMVKIPLELLQDSAIPLESLMADLLAERLGRILSDYMTTGTGSSQPQGIVYAATDASASSVAATALTRDNILDLIYSVNDYYRKSPKAALMMHDTTVKALAKLTFGTADDRPLWNGGNMAQGIPPTIEGYPYIVNNSMDEIGASAESIVFGDFNKFLIRRVVGTTLFVFREKYMDYLQIAIMAYNRWDSRLIDAGTHPIKKLVHAAT